MYKHQTTTDTETLLKAVLAFTLKKHFCGLVNIIKIKDKIKNRKIKELDYIYI